MHILLVVNSLLPAIKYGGTERVVWYLGSELVKKRHKVTFLCKKGSSCDFANCIFLDDNKSIEAQIPDSVDIIHFNDTAMNYSGEKPYIVTYHGNYLKNIDMNAVFVSKNHALRNGSDSYVYNGLDWNDYGKLNISESRDYYHFLGNAAWRVKNVQGAIDVVTSLDNQRLMVLGGRRLNFKMGFRFTLSPRVIFKGMVGGNEKINFLQHSKGLVFPVRWDEPFGLAITESLYCGAPVFGTPYGSLPELVHDDVGFLTSNKAEMISYLSGEHKFNPIVCHEYAGDMFNSKVMCDNYLLKYEKVMNGEKLNVVKPHAMEIESKSRDNYLF